MTDMKGPELVLLLRQMLLIRRFEEDSVALRMQGKIYGVVHPYIGQEAVAVGVCGALGPEDKVGTYHRGHGHLIAKGTSVRRMMAELFGRVDGCCKGKGGSMHIADLSRGMLGVNGIVAAGIPHALGAALAIQMSGSSAVVACFFGDGATGQGVFYESLNIAALFRLPVVLVCDNNLYSGPATPLHDVLASNDVASLSSAFGIPGATVDGADVIAVHAAARDAISRARSGGGPTLLDCRSYRWGAHAQRRELQKDARPAEELAAAMRADPIERLKSALLARGQLTEASFHEVERSVDAELEDAVKFAEASPFPEPAAALEDLFAPGS